MFMCLQGSVSTNVRVLCLCVGCRGEKRNKLHGRLNIVVYCKVVMESRIPAHSFRKMYQALSKILIFNNCQHLRIKCNFLRGRPINCWGLKSQDSYEVIVSGSGVSRAINAVRPLGVLISKTNKMAARSRWALLQLFRMKNTANFRFEHISPSTGCQTDAGYYCFFTTN